MKKKGKYLDRDGNPVDKTDPEGHIRAGENLLPTLHIIISPSAWDQYEKKLKKYDKDLKKYDKDMIKYEKDYTKWKKKCNCEL